MWVHFDTAALAIAHLQANGWSEIKNSAWVSRDRTCSASIHPKLGTDIVVINFRKIEGVA